MPKTPVTIATDAERQTRDTEAGKARADYFDNSSPSKAGQHRTSASTKAAAPAKVGASDATEGPGLGRAPERSALGSPKKGDHAAQPPKGKSLVPSVALVPSKNFALVANPDLKKLGTLAKKYQSLDEKNTVTSRLAKLMAGLCYIRIQAILPKAKRGMHGGADEGEGFAAWCAKNLPGVAMQRVREARTFAQCFFATGDRLQKTDGGVLETGEPHALTTLVKQVSFGDPAQWLTPTDKQQFGDLVTCLNAFCDEFSFRQIYASGGKPLTPGQRGGNQHPKCEHCGGDLGSHDALACPHCGKSTGNEPPTPEQIAALHAEEFRQWINQVHHLENKVWRHLTHTEVQAIAAKFEQEAADMRNFLKLTQREREASEIHNS